MLHPGRVELDLTSRESIAGFCAGKQIDCIVNPAAHTAVDAAEDAVGDAFLANAQGPAWLAEVARERAIPILHVSTDYVFDGSLDRPYRETDPVAPLGVYGASKLAGELAIRAASPRHVILRTAWVLSAHRNNFLKTMLRLAAERPELKVVADQFGCPTGARDIAMALRIIALSHLDDAAAPVGVYHMVNAGSTSWYELAQAIMAASSTAGGPSVPVQPIGSGEFPVKARRPANSRLDCEKLALDFGIAPRPWIEVVQEIVSEVLTASAQSGNRS